MVVIDFYNKIVCTVLQAIDGGVCAVGCYILLETLHWRICQLCAGAIFAIPNYGCEGDKVPIRIRKRYVSAGCIYFAAWGDTLNF